MAVATAAQAAWVASYLLTDPGAMDGLDGLGWMRQAVWFATAGWLAIECMLVASALWGARPVGRLAWLVVAFAVFLGANPLLQLLGATFAIEWRVSPGLRVLAAVVAVVAMGLWLRGTQSLLAPTLAIVAAVLHVVASAARWESGPSALGEIAAVVSAAAIALAAFAWRAHAQGQLRRRDSLATGGAALWGAAGMTLYVVSTWWLPGTSGGMQVTYVLGSVFGILAAGAALLWAALSFAMRPMAHNLPPAPLFLAPNPTPAASTPPSATALAGPAPMTSGPQDTDDAGPATPARPRPAKRTPRKALPSRKASPKAR